MGKAPHEFHYLEKQHWLNMAIAGAAGVAFGMVYTPLTGHAAVIRTETRPRVEDQMPVVTRASMLKETDEVATSEVPITAPTAETNETVSGINGTAHWEYNQEAKTMWIHAGQLAETHGQGIETWTPHLNDELQTINFDDGVMLGTDASYLFANLYDLTTLNNVSQLDVSQTQNMTQMFGKASTAGKFFQLRELDLNGWDTSHVTTMRRLFRGLDQLETLKIDQWQTGNVTDMAGMFTND